MARAISDEYIPIRNLLARHDSVVEVVRAANSLVPVLCEVVVFEQSWAYVVAASGGEVLQPRKLLDAEAKLLEEVLHDNPGSSQAPEEAQRDLRAGESQNVMVLPVLDQSRGIVAALTVHGPVDLGLRPALLALARVVTGIVVSQVPNASGDTVAGVNPAAVADGLRDAVFVLDSDFNIMWVNDAVASLLMRSRIEVVGLSAIDLIHPDDLEGVIDATARLVSGLTIYRILVRLSVGDGGWIRVEVTGTDQTSNPEIEGLVLSLRSAELDQEMEQDHQRSRQMSQALVEQLHDGLIVTDAVGAITLVNRAARHLFGIAKDMPTGLLTWRDLPLLDHMGGVVTRESHPAWVIFGASFDSGQEMSIVGRGGEHHYVSVVQRSVYADDGSLQGTFVTLHDVTEAREAQTELATQALHDQLTGLPNRRMLTERLVDLKSNLRGRDSVGSRVAACFLDLDTFKLINDTHGHRVGDQMIRISADRLSAQLREGDLLVRQGGDEFVALLAGDVTEELAVMTANRLRRSLAKPFIIDGTRFDITASAGIALGDLADMDEDTLLRQADIALYAAKSGGRNRTEVFDRALEVATEVEEGQRRMLRHALDNDGIVMHFQPLIDSRTGIPLAYEALARCLDAEGVLHLPAAFLDSIAGSGLVWELDQRAFVHSCKAAAVLAAASHDEPPLLACNFSPLSLMQPDLVSFVIGTAEDAGVRPETICIEITENAAFAGGEASLAAITELHEEGFQLALDDFGTGYSSLSHLRDLPLSSVKVDKSFVDKLTETGPERAIAEAVVGLATDLGLGVVAEGVETVAQLEAAQDLGFSIMQGWHYSVALPLDEILHGWVNRPTEVS